MTPVVADRIHAPLAPTATSLSVLVVDDSLTNRQVAEALLRQHGHAVVHAADGFEALQLCRRRRFDAVLMDLEMPRLGGIEAMRLIRALERGGDHRTRVIACTATTRPSAERRWLSAGMDAVVAKPLVAAELWQALYPTGDAQAAGRAHPPPGEMQLDSFGGNVELFRAVATTFVQEWPAFNAEFTDALERRDRRALGRLAHRARGTVGLFERGTCFSLAERLERLDDDADWPQREELASALLQGIEALAGKLAATQ